MDPTSPDSSMTASQKTSPHTDPATTSQIASEVSAQASVLTRHQQQLDNLSALTEQLVRAIQGQGLQAATPPAPPPATNPPAAAASITASPRLAFPEKFDGAPTKCKGFLLQCTLFVNQQPHLYPTDEGKIAFVCSLLTGRALDWATAVWDLGRPTFPSFATFLQSFKEAFQPSPESSEAGEQIMALKQGRRTAADYALDFRTLAAQSGWNDGPLKLHYRKGLNPDLQVELACRDEDLSLKQYIDLSIRVDNVMRARRPGRTSTSLPPTLPPAMTTPEPMQLGITSASTAVNPAISEPPALHDHLTHQPRQCEIPVVLKSRDISIKTTALIDSGAASNFIDMDFVTTNRLPVLSCAPPVAVAALDGRPLGMGRIEHTTDDLTLCLEPRHQETIRFFLISSPRTPLILGYPWLNLHEPVISWSTGTITHWSAHCKQHCPQSANPVASTPVSAGPRDSIPAEYQDLLEAFSTTKATQLPPHRPGDCAIDLLPGAVPPRGRIFPLSQPESEAMNQYIREELAKGFIRPSTSPASAGFFFVKKKDGGLRPCIDYRALNDITIKYRYPLPLVPPALEQLRRANIYTKLDLRSAYNLIRIREGDKWKTAFSTTTGHYEYWVMPFGLANSPSYFQAFVNDVFRDMLNRWVIIYIDDILIYSNSVTEHIQHVRAVLQRLIEHQLPPEGWPRPKTLKELQRFLGFSNFYRRFIRNFSTVAAALTSMIKQGNTRLTWSPSAAQAYDELRQRFTTAPILHHPDPNLPFLVEVDASSTGVGAVLSQRQGQPPKTFPCAFFSHKLSPAERNYDVGNRELLAIKLTLEEWRHWLEGAKHPFTILTDHRNLEYLSSARVLNHRQARWSLFFTRFQFEITYPPGSQNTKADALFRMHEPDCATTPPETILPASVILAPVAWDIMTEITEGQAQDPPPIECPENLTYVPVHLRSRVLSEVHSPPSSGHPGIEATIELLNNRFWWQSLRSDTITFIKNCSVCNTSKTPRQLPAGLLQPLPVPNRPWSHIAVDFVTDLPSSHGQTTILSVIDRFSKGCRFIPFPKLPTAMETAEALCNSVFRFYGLPEDIVSDRGPQFTSRLWSNFFHLLGVNVSLTSGYHPQANGQAERLNQELTRFLRSYCQDHQEDWSRFLLWAEYAQNSIRKPSTNLTPFQCILGYQPPCFPGPGSLRICLQSAPGSNGARRPGTGPMSTCNEPSTSGQAILRTRAVGVAFHSGPAPTPRYVGPFRITRQITPVSFRLELPPEYRISPTFHVSLLKPAGRPGGAENLEETAPQGPSPLIIDGEEVYRVNTILDSRRQRGRLQYLVDWEDYGPEERSWVPAEDILDPALTADFAPRSTRTPWKGKTPAPVTSSCQEALLGGGGGLLSQGRSLWLPPSSASGNPHQSSSHYISYNPLPGAPLPFPGHPGALPVWRPFQSAALLIMLSILSVFLSDCLPVANRTVYRLCEPLLPALLRPSLFPWIIPFDRRRPRPLAWTLTTPFGLPTLHQSAVVDPSLCCKWILRLRILP
ncbi:hypothetical protein M9458_015621 [Cirrhinus mrigala]|uniref:Gypsy retrotransposon integrase-like protein 1 n=1 Tax=Cirrhinus mrigala TaxID=683832 RepID=A0ABD0QQS5_CIRMR